MGQEVQAAWEAEDAVGSALPDAMARAFGKTQADFFAGQQACSSVLLRPACDLIMRQS